MRERLAAKGLPSPIGEEPKRVATGPQVYRRHPRTGEFYRWDARTGRWVLVGHPVVPSLEAWR